MPVINSIISMFSTKRLAQIDFFKENPIQVQRDTLVELLRRAADTEYGLKYDFDSILTAEQYRERLPIIHYEELAPYSERLMNGEQNLLWPEPITWFAKSSGTTAAKSKFIPVSKESLESCHFRGGKDVISIFNKLYPDAQVFNGKTLALGGSSEISKTNNNCRYGDLSAILISNTPFWANMMKTPDQSIMLMSEWEEKIEKICDTTIKEDVRSLAGVPSWFLTLINRILERTGKSNLHEVWPNLELFIHGGINFTPYREQYKRLLPDPKMKYMETYNASEGFFGLQDDPAEHSLLLMIDYGVFYEFIPINEVGREHPTVLPLEAVEVGKNYAMVITTSGGLWRYQIGDTIRFTSLYPHKFVISGRTKNFINAFGEELMVDNADKAISSVCRQTGAKVKEYTAAPLFMLDKAKGRHQWMIEFEKMPPSLDDFASLLDKALQQLNSDYEAKRYKEISLQPLEIQVAREGTFYEWLRRKGKLGGQHKIPRLSNDRTFIEELEKIYNL